MTNDQFGISLFECDSRKDSRPREMFKVIRSRGIVTKETVVFIGPDLGHVRTITPADRKKEVDHPLSVTLPSLVRQLEHLPSQKNCLFSMEGRSPSCDNMIRINNSWIANTMVKEKEDNQIHYPSFDIKVESLQVKSQQFLSFL